MKINTQVGLKNLAGEVLKNGDKEFTLGEAISNVLLSVETVGKMKLFLLAKKFFEGKEIDLDEADFNLVKTSVEQSKVYGALVLGQCEILLGEAE